MSDALFKTRSKLAEEVMAFLDEYAASLTRPIWLKKRHGEVPSAVVEQLARFAQAYVEPLVYTQKRKRNDEQDKTPERANLLLQQTARLYELAQSESGRELVKWSREVRPSGRLRQVVQGAPGSGKSFATRRSTAHLALVAYENIKGQRCNLDAVRLPLWVTARELVLSYVECSAAPTTTLPLIAKALFKAFSRALSLSPFVHSPLVQQWVLHVLTQAAAPSQVASPLFLVIDGLDELNFADLARFEELSLLLAWLRADIMLTCRTMNWESCRHCINWLHLTEIELAPLNARQKRELIRQCLASTSRNSVEVEQLLQANYALGHACSTPFLLAVTCWLYVLGRLTRTTTYGDLYAELVRNFVNGTRKSQVPPWADVPGTENRHIELLERIGWHLFNTNPTENFFTFARWEESYDVAARELSGMSSEEAVLLWLARKHVLDSGDLLLWLREVGFAVPAGPTTESGRDGFSFGHRTFLEYLAARTLSRKQESEWLTEVRPHFWFAPEWLEVLTFLASLVDDVTPLLNAIDSEEDDTFRSMLTLQIRFLKVAKYVAPSSAETLIERVVELWLNNLNDAFLTRRVSHWLTGLYAAGKYYVELLQDIRSPIRFEAIRALGAIASPEFFDDLVVLLKNGDSSWRMAVASAIANISPLDAIPYIVSLLKDDDEDVRWRASRDLRDIGSLEALPYLASLLKSSEQTYVKEAVLDVLGDIGYSQALPYLIPSLEDKDAGVRAATVGAIGHIDPVETLSYILPLLKDAEWTVRSKAAETLGEQGQSENLPYLSQLLQDTDVYVRASAVDAMGKIGSLQAFPVVLSRLQDKEENWHVRWVASQALRYVSSAEDLPRLLPLLKSKVRFERDAVLDVVGQVGSSQDLIYLIPLLKSNSSLIEVVEAAGFIGSIDAFPYLTPFIMNKPLSNNSYRLVRKSVVEALGRLGSPKAIPYFVPLLKDIPEVRHTIADALGRIGSPKAIPHLFRLVQDRDGAVRCTAMDALWNISQNHGIKIFRLED